MLLERVVNEGRIRIHQTTPDDREAVQAVAALADNAEEIRVAISLVQRGETSSVTIADDGVGMPANQGASLIENFRRGDASRRVDGAGLRLSLVATIAARHEIRWRLEDKILGLAVMFEFDA